MTWAVGWVVRVEMGTTRGGARFRQVACRPL